MAENSKIEWCDHTASPWYGCSKVHAGCDHCYAEAMSHRNPGTLGIWGDDGVRVKSKSFIAALEKFNRIGEREQRIQSVFPSLCDPFENRPELVPWRREMFEVADRLPWIRLLLLTKRPENILGGLEMWPMTPGIPNNLLTPEGRIHWDRPTQLMVRPNVWLGTSVSEQAHADKQIPDLLKCHDLSPVLFLSAEPLLGPVNVGDYLEWGRSGPPWLDWVICGGESGHNARPMHPDWARSLRDQCQAAGVPFLFKQWGEWSAEERPGVEIDLTTLPENESVAWGNGVDTHTHYTRVGKTAAGRLLDGREWNEFPTLNANP